MKWDSNLSTAFCKTSIYRLFITIPDICIHSNFLICKETLLICHSNEIIYIYEKSTPVSFCSYSICDSKIIWAYREYLSYVNLGINVVLSSTDFWRKIYAIKVLLSYIRIFRWHSLGMGRFTYYVMVFSSFLTHPRT